MAGRIAPAECRGVLRHQAQSRAIGKQFFEIGGKSFDAQLGLRNQPSAAGSGNGAGIGGLVIVGCVRIRNKHCRPADRRQFGDG